MWYNIFGIILKLKEFEYMTYVMGDLHGMLDQFCDMLNKNECDVKVYRSEDAWYGVTYKDDKDFVTQSIQALKANGTYPKVLEK